MLWKIEFTKEANNYALDSYPYNEDVLVAIESLAFLKDGVPLDNCLEIEPDLFWWTVASHHVVFQRTPNKLRIASIKPAE